jgi:hypothetical protein
MTAAQFKYFDDILNELLQLLQRLINEATDRPATEEPPATRLVNRVRNHRGGRPRIEIDPEFLRAALDLRPASQIGPTILNVSTRTVLRRAIEYGIRLEQPPVFINTVDEHGERSRTRQNVAAQRERIAPDVLDARVREALIQFPNFGRAMLLGHLKALGMRVTRRELDAAFLRVNGTRAEAGRPVIERRVYTVPGPNSLWHHDGHLSECVLYQAMLANEINRTQQMGDCYACIH